MRLAPEQIHKDWDAISQAIEASLPEFSSRGDSMRIHQVYKALMNESAECWLLSQGDAPYVLGVVYAYVDDFTKDKNLLIYALYGYKPIAYSVWTMVFKTIKEKAKSYGCNRLIAYSNLDRVIKIAEVLGWNTDFRFMFMEV